MGDFAKSYDYTIEQQSVLCELGYIPEDKDAARLSAAVSDGM